MYRLIVVDDDVDAVNNIAKDFPWEHPSFPFRMAKVRWRG